VKTISLGLSVWSGMTAVSGFATNFTQLGGARVGVGIGEASASPAAYSLLQDYFPREKRATALALYSAASMSESVPPSSLAAPSSPIGYAYTPKRRSHLALPGGQATFLAFGIPGLLLALLLFLTVREPARGAMDGLATPGDPTPFRSVGREFGAMFPPFSMIGWHGRPPPRRSRAT
jgi:MFS family permease